MLKNKLKNGDVFWYVNSRYFFEPDENGNDVEHLMWYAFPYEFHEGDDNGENYDPERQFETESEADEYAFKMTNEHGY